MQAFHFKGGQGAKTGTGGHLPGDKVMGRIAEVRGLPEGTPAVSPATLPRLDTRIDDFRRFADEVRERVGRHPDRVQAVGPAHRGRHRRRARGRRRLRHPRRPRRRHRRGTAASSATTSRCRPSPRWPAPAGHLDRRGRRDVTLIVTGGLRDAADFAKALALGADAVAVANSAIQAIGCLGMRACHTNNCPVGIATQKPHLRARLPGRRGRRSGSTGSCGATVELMQVLARACGHDHLSAVRPDDLTTFDRDMAHLTGIAYGGVGCPS